MSKIGLLSVYNHNYGSILQAYALQTVLRDSGHDTEIILYKKTNLFKQAKRLLYLPLLKATVKMKWKSIYCRCFHKDVFRTIIATREEAFSSFINNNLYFSKVYKGRTELINGTKNYDCFVLGSDQVWNPMNLGGDFYTMTFIPDDKTKIAYAPSFGVSQIPKRQKRITSKYLKRIDYISVREDDGVRLVDELINRKVQQVVDPTILLDKTTWDKIKGERLISQNYIFCYFISNNPSYRMFARQLSEITGLKIVTIPHVDEYVKSDENFGDIIPQGVGPLQFVNIISNADYVCTDSFHGMVFSTLYQRTFYAFNRYTGDGKDSTNSRLRSLSKLISMEDRIYKSDKILEAEDLKSPDFSQALRNLNALRIKSKDYLLRALEKVSGLNDKYPK